MCLTHIAITVKGNGKEDAEQLFRKKKIIIIIYFFSSSSFHTLEMHSGWSGDGAFYFCLVATSAHCIYWLDDFNHFFFLLPRLRFFQCFQFGFFPLNPFCCLLNSTRKKKAKNRKECYCCAHMDIYISISYKYDILNWTVEWFLSWVKEGRLFSSSPSDCDLPVHNCFWLHHTAVVSIRKCHDGTRHFEDGKGKDKSTIGPADKRKRKFKYNDDATIQIEPTVSKACPPPPPPKKRKP